MANPGGTPANLRPPWKPGQSGNPKGSNARAYVTARLDRMLKEKDLDGTVALVWLGAALGDESILKGRKPNFQFFKELLDRIEGKVPDKVETTATQADDDRDSLTEEQLDAWAEHRVQAAARRRHRQEIAGGPGVGDVEPAMEVGASPGGPERSRDGDGGGQDPPAPDHDAPEAR